MLITIDRTRIVHLCVLIATTLIAGSILTNFYKWNRLSAYGLTCTISCQISDVILKVSKEKRKLKQEEEALELKRLKKKQKENLMTGINANRKKKKRRYILKEVETNEKR